MSNSNDPINAASQTGQKQESPSTYFVQNRSSEDEMKRLQVQERLITASMNGLLVELDHPEQLKRVLDVGCGMGNWLIDMAQTYPEMSLVGVDISQRMIDAARIQAEQTGVGNRVTFRVMDALRMLEFPVASFDLVNMRLGSSFLRTWDWPKLLQEFRRVLRFEGIVRISDADIVPQSTSATQMSCVI